MLPIGEFRQPRSGPLMLLFANSLDGVRGGLVSGIQPAMGGLEGISRVGRTLGTPDAHPNLKEEPLWGQPPPAVRRSAAPLTVQHSCPPSPKKLRWRTGVPARPGSSTGVLPNSPPATSNHLRDAGLVRPDERVCEVRDLEPARSAHRRIKVHVRRASNLDSRLGCPPQPPKPLSKARKIRRDHPNH